MIWVKYQSLPTKEQNNNGANVTDEPCEQVLSSYQDNLLNYIGLQLCIAVQVFSYKETKLANWGQLFLGLEKKLHLWWVNKASVAVNYFNLLGVTR